MFAKNEYSGEHKDILPRSVVKALERWRSIYMCVYTYMYYILCNYMCTDTCAHTVLVVDARNTMLSMKYCSEKKQERILT